ncbi:hypothetical protein QJQ45_001182 [Haematococcus lacustris]|nr:hypothetical protein QJQ45_001182 [Haematococcus lacustris]
MNCLPSSQPVAATLPGCLNSTLGYACAQPLNAGGTTLHFTQGSTAPPPNICTGSTSLAAGSQPLPQGVWEQDVVHWALESPVQGYVGLSWASRAGVMIPADSVIGGRPYLDTYSLTSYSPDPAPNSVNWAMAGGVTRTPNGTTIICFSTLAASSPSASGRRRRLHQLLSQGRTPAVTSTMLMNWAVHNSHEKVLHVDAGSFELNPSTGVLVKTTARTQVLVIAHAILMLLAFVLIMPTGVLLARHRTLFINKALAGKAVWFHAHVACQLLAVACFVASVAIALSSFGDGIPANVKDIGDAHYVIGIVIIALIGVQVGAGAEHQLARPDMNATQPTKPAQSFSHQPDLPPPHAQQASSHSTPHSSHYSKECLRLVLLAMGARPAPSSPRRALWDLVHHNWGRVTLLLAWANCFLGIVYYVRGWGALDWTEARLLTAWLVPPAVVLFLLVITDVVLTVKVPRPPPKSVDSPGDVANLQSSNSSDMHKAGTIKPITV